jgi:putative membrane protein
MKRADALCVAVVAVILAGCSNPDGAKTSGSGTPAERGAAVGTGGSGANVRDPGEFVRDMALKNMAEIELSRMALEKAVRADVKAFAQMMIRDHEAAGNTLKSIASPHPIDWPARLDDKHSETAAELSRKQGPDFDRDYVKTMVDGHEDFAAKLESRLDVQSLADWKTAAAGRARTNALPEPDAALVDVKVRPNKSDDELTMKINQWAADTYPVAQKHLDAARALANAPKNRSSN